jgi:hypothetical protein
VDLKIIIAVIGSSVLAALVTALFSRLHQSKSITVRYVTEEREKWRESLKLAMSELSGFVNLPDSDDSKLKSIRKTSTYIKLCLNPNPKHLTDVTALSKIEELCHSPSYEIFNNLEKEIQLILKHDWERVKFETQGMHLALICFLFSSAFIYYSVHFYLKETVLYKKLQSVDSLSGLYSEILLGTLLLVVILYLVTITYHYINKLRLKIKR